jgi:hypothetical protein
MGINTWPNRLFAQLIIHPSGCVLWTGHVDSRGYGSISVGNKDRGVHRVVYELFAGPIPEGLHIDHLCRVKLCANAAHLEPVTCRENLLRGVSFSAVNAAKDRCDNGHLFDDANTYRRPSNGHRECRACNRAAVHRYKARKKEMSA